MSKNLDLPPNHVGKLERFIFSTGSIAHAMREIENTVTNYETQIDQINRECLIGGFPLIEGILTRTRDKNELKALATGLAKIANLVPVLDDLLVRKQTLELAQKDPNFFGWAFGDFSEDADTLVDQLTTLLKEESAS